MATQTVEVAMGVPALSAERAVTWPKRTKAGFRTDWKSCSRKRIRFPKFHGELFFRSGNAAVADRAPDWRK